MAWEALATWYSAAVEVDPQSYVILSTTFPCSSMYLFNIGGLALLSGVKHP